MVEEAEEIYFDMKILGDTEDGYLVEISKAELKKYALWIHELDTCIATSFRNDACLGQIMPCHLREGFYCLGAKPPFTQIPMCFGHHGTQTAIGEGRFFGEHIDSLMDLMRGLQGVRYDDDKAHEIIREWRQWMK